MPETLFYTLREHGITVCLIKTVGGFWARGVSICSERDQFWKARGKEIAYGRAHKAIERAADISPQFHACPILRSEVRSKVVDVLGANFKASMCCAPTNSFEEKLLQAKKWM